MNEFSAGIAVALGFVAVVLPAAIIAAAQLLLPTIAEKVALRQQFFAPFKQWCARLTGSLGELLYWIANPPPQSAWPLAYHIVSNCSEVHDLLAEADKRGWFAPLVKSEYEQEDLNAVRKSVDNLYHELELDNGRLWSELSEASRLLRRVVFQVAGNCASGLSSNELRQQLQRLLERVEKEIPE